VTKGSAILLSILALTGFAADSPATAAELSTLPRIRYASPWCYCCLHVSYVRHRELRTTYGIGFDPRNYDTTQPHYYYGPMRTYPRYWVTPCYY
jgi:hypothetical protein